MAVVVVMMAAVAAAVALALLVLVLVLVFFLVLVLVAVAVSAPGSAGGTAVDRVSKAGSAGAALQTVPLQVWPAAEAVVPAA